MIAALVQVHRARAQLCANRDAQRAAAAWNAPVSITQAQTSPKTTSDSASSDTCSDGDFSAQ